MRSYFSRPLAFVTVLALAAPLFAQQGTTTSPPMKHQDTEVYEPVPPIVTPGVTNSAPPSDAIVLFDGKNLDQWVTAKDHSPALWDVHDGIVTVSKAPGVGNIETKRKFKNYQLHVEWRIPENITGSDQARGQQRRVSRFDRAG